MQRIFTGICIFLTFLYLFILFFRPITAINEDLGRHLLLGKIITQQQAIPTTNLLSYTYPDYPFTNSHWFSEVIFYQIFSNFGFDGLLVFTTIISLLSFFFIFQFVYKRYAFVAYFTASFLYIHLLLGRTDVRPELFSFFFLSIFVTTLYRYYQRYTKWLLLLVPLEILWVNIHIYFFTGLVVLYCFLLDQLVKKKFRFTQSSKHLGLTTLLATAGTLLNPHGLQGALFPLTVHTNYGLGVLENQSYFYFNSLIRDGTHIFFTIVLLLLFVCLIITRKQTKLVDWLLAGSFTLAGMLVIRNIPLFAYATFIPFTAALSQLIRYLRQYWIKHNGKTQLLITKTYSITLLLLVLLFAIIHTFSVQQVGFGVTDRGKKAVDFFQKKYYPGTDF